MRRFILPLVLLALLAEGASAAIISAATGKRRGRTSGIYRVITTTSGQRRIAITIDPWSTLEFQLDLSYPQGLAEPLGFLGFDADLAGGAVTSEGPYALAGPRPQTVLGSAGPCISNVRGAAPPDSSPAALANNPAGGSDLFTAWFIDNAPAQDKIFRILGLTDRGIDPAWERFIADNYLDVLIDDPADPENGQVVRIGGADIEGAAILVPGIDPSEVPLPPALAAGLGAAVVAIHRGRALARPRDPRRGFKS